MSASVLGRLMHKPLDWRLCGPPSVSCSFGLSSSACLWEQCECFVAFIAKSVSASCSPFWGCSVGKAASHKVLGAYAWFWGDFFFRMEQELTFDGIFEMVPHPMYTVRWC